MARPLALALLFLLLPALAGAAVFRQADELVVPAGETIDDDLYASGGTVRISATINGDLVVAGGEVTIDGPVGGDLLVAGGSLILRGPVRGSIRAAGGDVVLEGEVGEDAVLAGGQLELSPKARIGRDLVAATGDLDAAAPVGRNAWLAGNRIELRGTVAGDANLAGQTVTLHEGARIAGDLRLPETSTAEIPPDAVGGKVLRYEVEDAPGNVLIAAILFWIRLLVGFFLLGLLLLWLAPHTVSGAVATLRADPWRCLGYGILFFLGLPIVAAIAFLFGLFVGGWWIALLALLAWLTVALCALPVAGLSLGSRLLGGRGLPELLLLLIGLAILLLLTIIPFIGPLILLAAIFFGIGALLLSALELRRRGPRPIG